MLVCYVRKGSESPGSALPSERGLMRPTQEMGSGKKKYKFPGNI